VTDTVTTDGELQHYGILRRSGRYPWGSGESVEQSRNFLSYVDGLKQKGLSEGQIAEGFGATLHELRAARSIASNETRAANATQALRLKDKGMGSSAIAARMGIPESSVRSLLKPALDSRQDSLLTTANMLRDKVGKNKYLQVGVGVENQLGISATKLATAVAILREEGYDVRNIQVKQLGTGPGQKTTVKVLVPPGAPKFIEPEHITTVGAFSDDGGHSYTDIKPPRNVSLSRVGVRYAEDGGAKADGVIYVRPGVQDLSLGRARYAQVRIAVNGTHYLKGMAMYKNDLPAGVDLQFNTNKHSTGNPLDAMKKQGDDPENPFGSRIDHQKYYPDGHGHKQLSPMNIVNEEGDWRDWSRSLSSQVLSKQSVTLAKRQLDAALAARKDDLNEITRLTNPVVKRKMLEDFADGTDADAVDLKAHALPKQGTHVILPIESLKEGEIYAPNYQNGTRVALVRFPHGGPFEIPELVVNNKHAPAKAALDTALDAVGIHPKVAARLSGADFDGDTVLVIPNNHGAIKTKPSLKGLEGFDPQSAYAPFHGMRTIDGGVWNADKHEAEYPDKPASGKRKQHLMGDVSNLITDMSIKGASDDELAAAVRHSMVVIDSEKHALNYKQSYIDNRIATLKKEYQGVGPTGRLRGASTIVSRASSEERVADRKLRRASEGGPVDPVTGRKVFVTTGKPNTISSTKLAEETDARKLSSGMPIEEVYANHSNALKALANDARKASLVTGTLVRSPTARETYSSEVGSLRAKLNTALKNAPLERQAQLIANAALSAKRAANPGMDDATIKKLQGMELQKARARIGAKKEQIHITNEEWRAIQSGAISATQLREILKHADTDRVRELATPRKATVMTPSKLALAQARLASGFTQAEVAESLGIPVSTLNTALHRKE
jgi:hypothetical protein